MKILLKAFFIILCVTIFFLTVLNICGAISTEGNIYATEIENCETNLDKILYPHTAPIILPSISIDLTNPISKPNFTEIIESALMWILSVAGSIALLMFIIAGIMYVISSGDEQKITVAKKMFNLAIVGLALILLSYSIILVLNDILA